MSKELAQMAADNEASDLLMDGLTSIQSYIKLAGSDGHHLAAAPLVMSYDDSVLILGVKLRSAWDATYGGGKPKVTPVDEVQAVQMLHQAYPGIEWQKMDGRRLSTPFGIAVAASRFDREAYENQGKSPDEIIGLVVALIESGGTEIKNKDKVVKILSDAIRRGLDSYFMTPTAGGNVGETSEAINLASGFDNVVSFAEKIKAKNQDPLKGE